MGKDVWLLGMRGVRGEWPAFQNKRRNPYLIGEKDLVSAINIIVSLFVVLKGG